MRDADRPRFAGMGENVMAALYSAQCPSIRFELLNNQLQPMQNLHGFEALLFRTVKNFLMAGWLITGSADVQRGVM